MRIIIQRVQRASVTVQEEIIGSIGHGLLLLVGIHQDDTEETVKWCCDKLLKLRIFADEEGKMNRSVRDVNGGILVVSQFTLYGRIEKGTRPGFTDAMAPEPAEKLYNWMVAYLKSNGSVPIEEGEFAATMDVSLINDGPVTILMER
ncbi:MAG: D-aminoacyl-tRNA deacylase [Balneolaceae bacterium]